MDDRHVAARTGEGVRLLLWVLTAGVLPTWLLVSALVTELVLPPFDLGPAGLLVPEILVRFAGALGLTAAWMLLLGLVVLPLGLVVRARRGAQAPSSLGEDVVIAGPVRVRVVQDGGA